MIRTNFLVCSLAALAILAGCNNSRHEGGTPVPVTAPKVVEQPIRQDVRDIHYYRAHLDEAKETWHQCLAANPNDITEEIRNKCVAAQTAWETQPYKSRSQNQ